MTSLIKEDLANMANIFNLSKTIPPRFARVHKNTNRDLVQLEKLLDKIGGAMLTKLRASALSLAKGLAQSAASNRKVEGKRSAAPAEYIILADSDEDLLDESPNDDVAETSDKETETRHECVSCTEEYSLSDIIQTECAHSYCHKCIVRIFENSLTTEALFPPQCCRQPIRASTAVEDMIGIEMMKRYKERKIEVSDSRRTYCSNSTCSRYIPPQNIRRGLGICEVCTARTCTGCKKQGHRGDCNYKNAKKRRRVSGVKKTNAKKTNVKKANVKKANDEKVNDKKVHDEKVNDDLLEALAKKKKWQRCSNCSRIIERVSGCPSIL
ncbi:hypothetical protein N7471_005529 [Penicillium samsonianum]|uniref:uncharacterized protein n=1 Tax=Penicillium samsonianum TaxID=1882272 RepID=UPI0025482F24|nr:uncharacterized protein N7471_005529 [Penicillium samsonianum]KAJ6139043.1 hypothetical protein N7471_005529 [Penicillium samsonianum]